MHQIQVFFEEEKNDAESLSIKKDIASDLNIELTFLKIVRCYYINAELSLKELEEAAKKLFADPVVQKYSIDEEAKIDAEWMIEVKLHSGVTDNEGNAAVTGVQELLNMKFKENEWIKTSKKYFISGKINETEIKRICTEMLANEVVESFEYKKLKEQ
jgi:phosphoribosylformylglycinamidine synthase